jgi:CRP-like cAMP-binding protein
MNEAATERIGEPERRWLTDGRKNLGFMGALDTIHLHDIIACMTLGSYPAGAKVCVEGDPGDAFFIIYDGGVEVTKKGWDEPVGRLIPGEFFGEMSLLFRKPRSASVTTTKPTRLFTLKAADFSRMLKDNPALADVVKAVADARLRELARS